MEALVVLFHFNQPGEEMSELSENTLDSNL